MPTKLEQVAALLQGMTPLELDCARDIAEKHLELAKVSQSQNTKCRLLGLPAELRDLIWIFAGIIHLRSYGNTKRCGLLRANKQIRIEFMDVFYSDKVVKQLSIGHINTRCFTAVPGSVTMKFQRCADKRSLKALLDGGAKIARITGGQFAISSTMKAEIAIQIRVWRDVEIRNKAMHIGLLVLSSGDRANSLTFRCGSHWERYGSKYIVTDNDSEEDDDEYV